MHPAPAWHSGRHAGARGGGLVSHRMPLPPANSPSDHPCGAPWPAADAFYRRGTVARTARAFTRALRRVESLARRGIARWEVRRGCTVAHGSGRAQGALALQARSCPRYSRVRAGTAVALAAAPGRAAHTRSPPPPPPPPPRCRRSGGPPQRPTRWGTARASACGMQLSGTMLKKCCRRGRAGTRWLASVAPCPSAAAAAQVPPVFRSWPKQHHSACLQVASGNPSAVLRPSLWKQRTAAHLAARAGAAAALAVVLDVAGHAAGGLPTDFLNAPDHAGDTALALAAKHGCGGVGGVVKVMPSAAFDASVACPAAPPAPKPTSCLPSPCSHADCVRELLEAGASPLPANTQGATALHYAAARGQAACIRLLLTAPVRLPGVYRKGGCRRSFGDINAFLDGPNRALHHVQSTHCSSAKAVARADPTPLLLYLLQRAAAAGRLTRWCQM